MSAAIIFGTQRVHFQFFCFLLLLIFHFKDIMCAYTRRPDPEAGPANDTSPRQTSTDLPDQFEPEAYHYVKDQT